jgi:hypothetical protein
MKPIFRSSPLIPEVAIRSGLKTVRQSLWWMNLPGTSIHVRRELSNALILCNLARFYGDIVGSWRDYWREYG